MNSQSLDLKNDITKLHNLIISEGKALETYERVRVGCKPYICSLYDLVVLDRIVCKDLCYITKDHKDKISDYLTLKSKR